MSFILIYETILLTQACIGVIFFIFNPIFLILFHFAMFYTVDKPDNKLKYRATLKKYFKADMIIIISKFIKIFIKFILICITM